MVTYFLPIGILLSGIFLTTGCQNRASEDNRNTGISQSPAHSIIDLERDFKTKEFRLSEIVDSIEYIKLEKTPESLIGGSNLPIYITREFIFVYHKNRVLQFSRNGKFIKQIGRFGKGPGEYQGTRGFALDELSGILYLIGNFNSEIMKYDIRSGAYLGSFPVNPDLGSAMLSRSFKMIDKNSFALLGSPAAQYTPVYELLEIIDNEGSVLSKIKSSLFTGQNAMKRVQFASGQIWAFQNHIRVFEALNDTVYNIENNILVPAFIFNQGKYKGPFDVMTTQYVNQITAHPQFITFWETTRYLFMYFYFDGTKIHLGQFDKLTGEFCRLTGPGGNTIRMYNDIDGGLSFLPRYLVDNVDDEWCQWYEAIDLKEGLTSEYLKNSEAKHPEKKERLRKFMNELSVEDNPVLMIVKLKRADSE